MLPTPLRRKFREKVRQINPGESGLSFLEVEGMAQKHVALNTKGSRFRCCREALATPKRPGRPTAGGPAAAWATMDRSMRSASRSCAAPPGRRRPSHSQHNPTARREGQAGRPIPPRRAPTAESGRRRPATPLGGPNTRR